MARGRDPVNVASIVDSYDGYEMLRFPAFLRASAHEVSTRVFRVPGMPVSAFVGEAVKQALEASEVTGLRFVGVDWS